jgi:uncharacterized protein (DUF885 family)
MRYLLIAAVACGSPKPSAVTPPPSTPPVAVAAPATPATPTGPDVATRRAQLAALLDEHWEYTLRTSPETATDVGDRRYNDRWSDRSAEAIAAEYAQDRAFLARFEAIDTTGFDDQELLDKQLMVRKLREDLEDEHFESWLMPVNQFYGTHLSLARIVSETPFDTVDDYEAYLKRLSALPTVLQQTETLMRAGMAKQLMPPKILLVQVAKQATSLADGKPEASPFARPLDKFPDAIPQADRARLRAAIVAAIHDKVQPAYRTFATFVTKDYAPHGRTDPGVWSLPDGDARYATRIKRSTTTAMTADEIHQIGLDEVKRIEGEQEAIGKRLGFPTLAAFRKHVAANKKLYATSKADILARYQKYIDQMYTKLPELFGRLPKAKVQVLATEPFREKESAGADYNQGTPDGSRPGIIRVNTYEPTKRVTTSMESTAYHEGVPGHHLQISIAQELSGLAKYRQHLHFTAYIEGWALYSERLGKEVGFYTDPYNDYGRLEDEMLRAIRLVVDTGLHAKKWTRAQVVQYFHDHSTMPEVDIQAETDRYIGVPGQALGYKIGQLAILRIREKARAALGPAFDVRAFHDEVLGAGALPLDVLDARIDAWIAKQKAR